MGGSIEEPLGVCSPRSGKSPIVRRRLLTNRRASPQPHFAVG